MYEKQPFRRHCVTITNLWKVYISLQEGRVDVDDDTRSGRRRLCFIIVKKSITIRQAMEEIWISNWWSVQCSDFYYFEHEISASTITTKQHSTSITKCLLTWRTTQTCSRHCSRDIDTNAKTWKTLSNWVKCKSTSNLFLRLQLEESSWIINARSYSQQVVLSGNKVREKASRLYRRGPPWYFISSRWMKKTGNVDENW